MNPEQHILQGLFAPTEMVMLRQACFTPSRMFEPGVYFAGQLPGIAFEMGLVDKLPPVRGKNAEIRPDRPEPNDA
jgi:hypothetical protein